MNIAVRVQVEDFDLAAEYQALRNNSAYGAIVTFTGLVRELQKSTLTGMTLEHYPGMTESALQKIAEDAHRRWQPGAIRIIHRTGHLQLNDQIVFVGVADAHRAAAFSAAEFIMDYLKTSAPFWKKEHTSSGDNWVEAKEQDALAKQRWDNSPFSHR
jgi:molybdopterin synthase catalytic subunit